MLNSETSHANRALYTSLGTLTGLLLSNPEKAGNNIQPVNKIHPVGWRIHSLVVQLDTPPDT
jgi:hypothetical protein